MNRSIRITKAGIDKNGQPWAQGVCGLTADEQLQAMRLDPTFKGAAAFGILNGVAADDIALLHPGDTLEIADDGVAPRFTVQKGDGQYAGWLNTSWQIASDASIVLAEAPAARISGLEARRNADA